MMQYGNNTEPKKPCILIIEDDPLLSELLVKKISDNDFVVLVATHEQEINEALTTHRVDLILLDVLLPELNGIDFLKKIKSNERHKDIPVIIISNLGQQEEIDEGLSAGAVDYVVKASVLPDEILERVKNLLKKENR